MTLTVGTPLARVDGYAKVTGQATYAAEFSPPHMAYAVAVSAWIGKGRIRNIDSEATEKLPGVLAVISHFNAPRLLYRAHKGAIDPAVGERLHVLQDDAVRHWGQPVAVVVAESLEQAEHGASALPIFFDAETPEFNMAAGRRGAVAPEAGMRPGSPNPANYERGNAEEALTSAEVNIDVEYAAARQNHNPMEPHATIAQWEGSRLTVWDKNQWVSNAADELAAVFGIPSSDVHVVCPFIGGAFGTSLRTWPHATLAAVAAKHVGRPVKLMLSRKQMFFGTGYRPATWQRLRIGASRDGRLSALKQEAYAETSRYEQYTEAVLSASRMLYSCPNLATVYRLVPQDVHTPTFMRGPGEASGVYALECAVDELAYELGMDPIEFRARNEPRIDEERDLPFSSRALRECYRIAAQHIGWERRRQQPRTLREGNWLIGLGVASSTYRMVRSAAGATVHLLSDGTAVVETSAADMGPGTYTSLTQVACDELGMTAAQVRVIIGDSRFPRAPPHGGSQTMASVGSAVLAACRSARTQAARLAIADARSPLHGADVANVVLSDATLSLVSDSAREESLCALLARQDKTEIAATETSQPGDERTRFSMHAFGAVFAEVGVDADFGLIRVRRLCGAYAVGRVINPRMAHSQAIGGMVGGIGMALMEQTNIDRRDGRIVNASIADYLVPVNADIPVLDAVFVDELDPHVNPLGAKGLGEVALVGVAPAIANAVFNATGKRIRSLPIVPEMLL